MYRAMKAEVVAADGADLSTPVFGPRTFYGYQTRDLEDCTKVVRIGPSDSELTLDITPVATGYFVWVTSDYPVILRFNGSSATQFTMTSNNVNATNVGAPLPDSCIFAASMTVTGVRITPITGAQSTANVKILITGDPASSYT